METLNKTRGYFPESKHIALFLDLDNFNLRGRGQEISLLLNAVNPWGKVVIRRAYGRAIRNRQGIYEQLLRHRFTVEECGRVANKKNSADIHITVEVMEMLHTRPGIRTFAIASGDSDFIALVNRLHEHQCSVIGVGSRSATAPELVRSCDRFLFYESMAAGADQNRALEIAKNSTPFRVGGNAMRTLLRRRNLYPPDPDTRGKILECLEKTPVGPGARFRSLQEQVVDRCAARGISKTSVRNCVRALTRAGLLVPQIDIPLSDRPVLEIPSRKVMEVALERLMTAALLADENVVVDPLAIAEAIWNDTSRTGHIEKLLQELTGYQADF